MFLFSARTIQDGEVRTQPYFPFTLYVLYLCPATGGNRLEFVLTYTMLFS